MAKHAQALGRVAMAAALVFASFPARAWAWGKDGHRIVGQIAESHLTPAARAAVDKLLGDGKHLSDDDVANWADHIRGEFPETGPWHYVDIPVEGDGKYDPARDCKYSDCVIDRIERFREVLANKEAKFAERQRALKFLVHFVGDLHQPLHCAERRDNAGKPDQGGNLCFVRFLDEPKQTNLHKVWDFQILERSMAGGDPLDFARKLDRSTTAEKQAEWSRGRAKDWAAESFRLAVNSVYAGVAADGPRTTLDRDYVERGQRVIDDQLARAGIRLAQILNETLE